MYKSHMILMFKLKHYLLWSVQNIYWLLLCLYFQLMYSCTHPGCLARLNNRRAHQLHMRRHQGIYTYTCPYCNKGLDSTTGIKYHLKTHHTGILGYHCNKCRREFQNVHDLKLHLDSKGAECSNKSAGNSQWVKDGNMEFNLHKHLL